MSSFQPLLSVIICTHNRANILKECLEKLATQLEKTADFEALIIDNNSSDTTALIAKEFTDKYPNFKYFFESKVGLSSARNTGYKNASADWINYLDDDGLVSDNYVKHILEVINNFDFDAFGGSILPWYKFGKPVWYKDSYCSVIDLDKTGILPEDKFANGGVLCIKKAILEEVNGFRENIGMKGKKVYYGEETHLQIQLRNKGYKIGYSPGFSIDHLVPLYKQKAYWFLKSAYYNGKSYWDTFSSTPPKTRRIIFRFFLSYAFKHLQKNLPHKTKKMFSEKDFYIQNFIVELLGPVCWRLGACVSGLEKNWQ